MSERLVAVATLVAGAIYLASALPLPRGTLERPGAGFFPLVVGVFLCVVAVAFVVASFRRPSSALASASAAESAGGARARVCTTAAGLVGFCLFLPRGGYSIAAFAFVALLLWRLGGSWKMALVIALVSAVGSYYLFAVLLGVPLPRLAWLD